MLIEEQIAKELTKIEQLKRQKRSKDIREKRKKKEIDTRRQIIVGKLILKYFPEFLRLQPCRTEAENNIELETLNVLISILADDKQYVLELKKRAYYKLSSVNCKCQHRNAQKF